MARHKRRWWERLRRHSGYVGRHRATSASEAWNLGVSLAEAYPAYYTSLHTTAPVNYWTLDDVPYDPDIEDGLDVCWPEGVDGKCPQCRTPKHRGAPQGEMPYEGMPFPDALVMGSGTPWLASGVSLIDADVESLDELFKVDEREYEGRFPDPERCPHTMWDHTVRCDRVFLHEGDHVTVAGSRWPYYWFERSADQYRRRMLEEATGGQAQDR